MSERPGIRVDLVDSTSALVGASTFGAFVFIVTNDERTAYNKSNDQINRLDNEQEKITDEIKLSEDNGEPTGELEYDLGQLYAQELEVRQEQPEFNETLNFASIYGAMIIGAALGFSLSKILKDRMPRLRAKPRSQT